ncbi:Fms-interacting protein-domain-containing protein [Lipomyces tetrasporus]
MEDTDMQSDSLPDALSLIRAMREHSDRAFELLVQLSKASAAAAAAIPSPEPHTEPEAASRIGQDDNAHDEGELTEADAEKGQNGREADQMDVDESSVPVSKDSAVVATESEFVDIAKALLAQSFQLRKVNRLYQVSSKGTKEFIGWKRLEVDRLQLELQNMHYRQRYLRKEIEQCNDFPSSHALIDFVPLEQFYEDNPKCRPGTDSSKPNGDGNLEGSAAATENTTMADNGNERGLSEHRIMMARLEDERARRLKLEEKRKELSQIRSNLVTENKKRKEDLESLDAQLQRFIESATPIQNVFQKY